MLVVKDISVALAEQLRLRLILLLCDSKLSVKCLVVTLRAPQSTISRHLSILKKAGLVKSERKNKHIFYSLSYSGELGSLKKKLILAYQSELKNMQPYLSDLDTLMVHSGKCDSGCIVLHEIDNVLNNSKSGPFERVLT